MLPIPPPASESRPAQALLENAVLAFCREVAKQMDPEGSKISGARANALRAQADALSPVTQRGLPPESLALPLLEATTGTLESLCGDEVKGERRYGRAAKAMSLRWRDRQLALPQDSLARIPELEGLALLYELGGLCGTPWRDEVLRLRARAALAGRAHDDSALAKDLAGAVEQHYGPWLTVANVEPMLEFSGLLLRVWENEKNQPKLTQQVASLALKKHAERVWRLAARKGSTGLCEDLGALLDRLDAGLLLKDWADPALQLGEALLGSPVELPARRLLKRLDAAAAKAQTPAMRRRIARLLGDWETEADLLAEALPRSASGDARLELLRDAASLLEQHAHARLLSEATRVLRTAIAKGVHPEDDGWGFPEALITFADLHRAAGQADEAEALIQLRLDLEDPEGRHPANRFRLLARLNRWNELQARLGTPGADNLELLGWRYRCALGLGQKEEVQTWALAWIDAALKLEGKDRAPNLPGLARAKPWLVKMPEKLTALATRFGAEAAPGLEDMLREDPAWMLAALDPEASENPAAPEANLRWRMQRLPANATAALKVLEQLRQAAECRLGGEHLLVAELLLEQARLQQEDGTGLLEQARDWLEKLPEPEKAKETGTQPGRAKLLIAAYQGLVEVHAREGDTQALEKDVRGLLEALERGDSPDKQAVDSLSILWLHFWRQQRLNEFLAMNDRLERLHIRASGVSRETSETEEPTALRRSARFLAQLQGAGWP